MLFFSFGFFVLYSLSFRMMQISNIRYYKVKPTKRREPSIRIVFDFIMMTFIFLAVFTLGDQPVRLLPMIIGSLVTVIGYFVGDWAMRYLGKNYVDGVGLHDKHELVTDGPYRYVRHPLYFSIGLSYIGIAIFSWNLYLAIALTSAMCVFVLRALGEDSLLSTRLTAQHRRYVTNTGMLIPRIRKRG